MNCFPLISDPIISVIPIVENGEPFVDLKNYPELKCDLTRSKIQKLGENPFLVRKPVAEKLIHAQKLLPTGLKFEIKECFRPLWVQNKFYKSYARKIKIKYPTLSKIEIHNEVSKYIAPIAVAPHATGAAVDLVLIDSSGNELDMGTQFNASPVETENRTYTFSELISSEAKFNRIILVNAMEGAGFTNYPTEWWHWSYGDQYWAHMTKNPKALYEPKKLTFHVRKALLTDINEIGDVHLNAWRTTYSGVIDQDFLDKLELPERIESAKRRVESPNSNCYVAVETELNKIVGFADFGKCREKNVDADGELYAIYFYEEFQNFGAGRMLFEFCFNQMKEMNNKKVMVSLFEKNEETKRFYEKMGGQSIAGDHVDIEGIRYPTATYIWNLV